VSPGRIVTEAGEKRNPPLPTVTVTVVPLAIPEHRIRSEVIVIAAAITRDEKLFIASIFQGECSDDLPPHAILER
jgi:hypothetical protein